MIKSRKELKFYLMADEIMNEQVFPHGFIKRLFVPNPIQSFMRCMRILEYYDYKKTQSKIYLPIWLLYRIRYNQLSIKNGFSISAMSMVNHNFLIENEVVGGTCTQFESFLTMDRRTAV